MMASMNHHFVYITASKRNGTLYIGKTAALAARIDAHKKHAVRGFTEKYNVTMLVHYEVFDTHEQALRREKQLKEWKRKWKLELIEKNNPGWKDLFPELEE